MTEESLIGGTVAINQFRNAIYELIKILKQEKGYSDNQIVTTLRQMGNNIAENYFRFWTPKNDGLEDALKELYEFMFRKKVKVKSENKSILITQKSCPFCKYRREETKIAGCNIILGVIEKYFEFKEIPLLKHAVISSKTLGDKKCIHRYDY